MLPEKELHSSLQVASLESGLEVLIDRVALQIFDAVLE